MNKAILMRDSKDVCEVDGFGYHPGMLFVCLRYRMDNSESKLCVCLMKWKISLSKSNICMCLSLHLQPCTYAYFGMFRCVYFCSLVGFNMPKDFKGIVQII